MPPVLRALLIILLLLAQMAAPLVHAHVGGRGDDVAGVVHIPGLEAFAQPQGAPALLSAWINPEQPGMIIGIANGVHGKSDLAPLPLPWPADVPPPSRYTGKPPVSVGKAPPNAWFVLSPFLFQVAAPRAPPARAS